MEDIIDLLKTAEECQKIAKIFSDLSNRARLKSVELRAIEYGFKEKVEFELLKVLYAYEDVLTKKHNRKTPAARTWQMVKRDGIIKAAEKAVNREADAMGYQVLADMEMKDLTFEAVIIRYPKYFSKEAVIKSKSRLEEMEKNYAARFNEK